MSRTDVVTARVDVGRASSLTHDPGVDVGLDGRIQVTARQRLVLGGGEGAPVRCASVSRLPPAQRAAANGPGPAATGPPPPPRRPRGSSPPGGTTRPRAGRAWRARHRRGRAASRSFVDSPKPRRSRRTASRAAVRPGHCASHIRRSATAGVEEDDGPLTRGPGPVVGDAPPACARRGACARSHFFRPRRRPRGRWGSARGRRRPRCEATCGGVDVGDDPRHSGGGDHRRGRHPLSGGIPRQPTPLHTACRPRARLRASDRRGRTVACTYPTAGPSSPSRTTRCATPPPGRRTPGDRRA